MFCLIIDKVELDGVEARCNLLTQWALCWSSEKHLQGKIEQKYLGKFILCICAKYKVLMQAILMVPQVLAFVLIKLQDFRFLWEGGLLSL